MSKCQCVKQIQLKEVPHDPCKVKYIVEGHVTVIKDYRTPHPTKVPIYTPAAQPGKIFIHLQPATVSMSARQHCLMKVFQIHDDLPSQHPAGRFHVHNIHECDANRRASAKKQGQPCARQPSASQPSEKEEQPSAR